MISKFIAVTSLWFAAVAISVGTMVYGYGCEVKSWWWIIGGGVFGRLIMEVIAAICKREEPK